MVTTHLAILTNNNKVSIAEYTALDTKAREKRI